MDSNPSDSQEADKTPPPGSASSNTFLFVNESTAKAGKKVGRRTDIKSHVRNHIVQREKKNKTRDDQAASSASLDNLDSGIVASLKGKEKETRSTGRAQISQAGVPISNWNQASSASFSGTRESVPPVRSEELPVPPPTDETVWYHIHAPIDQSQFSSALPKPNIVSDVLERAILLTIENSLGGSELYQEHGNLSSQVYFSSSRHSGARSLLEAGYHTNPSSQFRNCGICDDPNRSWMDCAQHGSARERQGGISDVSNDGRFQQLAETASKRQAFSSKPLDHLGKLASGRVDPFKSYPSLVADTTGTLNELFDHSVTYLLPGLIADGSSKDSPSLLSKSWMAAALKAPLLFHALVFSASIHLSFLRTSTIHPNSKISLTHKQAVIQQLNEVLNSPTERIRDEIILAILILASHEVMDLNPAEEFCFDSPLKKMQWLNVYGNIRNVQAHLLAVMNLVNLRGGVESLELYGLAELLLSGDVVAATTSLSPPVFQPLHRSTKWLQSMINWSTSSPRPQTITIGSAFHLYSSHGLTPEMITIFHQISAVTLGIAAHVSGDPTAPSSNLIARTRTACQQKLLSLPLRSQEIYLGELPNIYESVRLTANIFAIAVIFPIPRSAGVLQVLVHDLVLAVEEADLERYAGVIPNILLWILMLGGIAAQGKVEGPWFVEKLVAFARRWDVGGWKVVEDVLETFLWLDSACGVSGRKLWGVVGERRVEMDTNMWLASSP